MRLGTGRRPGREGPSGTLDLGRSGQVRPSRYVAHRRSRVDPVPRGSIEHGSWKREDPSGKFRPVPEGVVTYRT